MSRARKAIKSGLTNSVVRHFFSGLMSPGVWDGSATVAFYVIFASFSGLLLMVSVASFVPYENFMAQFSNWWLAYLPTIIQDPVAQVLMDVSSGPEASLLSFSVLTSLWTSSSGVSAIIRQLHVVHGIEEKRSWLKHKLTALIISVFLGSTFFASFFILVLGRSLSNYFLQFVDIPFHIQGLLPVLGYLSVGFCLFLVFSIIYYMGPDRRRREHRVLPGSLLATFLFLVGSLAYSFYISNFANFSVTYGSIGAVIGLLTWLYLLGLSVLIGALFNHSLDKCS